LLLEQLLIAQKETELQVAKSEIRGHIHFMGINTIFVKNKVWIY
jgi:hypothetical protein